MKVQDLRQLLGAADRAHLEKAFVESYKQLQKAKKEEIDAVLVDILQGKEVDKKKGEGTVNFEDLKLQITVFIENAYEQNYLAPNRVIPKSLRPKWRFLVKDFIHKLESIPLESENYLDAITLLSDLYHLICTACNYYLFSTDDPFRSIGWEQPKLFELLVKKTFALEYTRENISRLILSATTGGLSRESLHIQQEFVLIGGLKTSDVKYIAIEEAKKQIEEKIKALSGLKKYDNQRYDLEEAVNELCGMILLLSILLAEPEKGVEYYFKYAKERDIEISLYRILDRISWLERDELWVQVYEYGIKKKIEPRDYLKDKYEELVGLK